MQCGVFSNNIFSHIVAVGVPSKSLILQGILNFLWENMNSRLSGLDL